MRVARIDRHEVPEEAYPVWDALAGSRGEVRGPFQALIRVPRLADAVGKLGAYLRYEGTLDDAEREIAILAASRVCGSVYQWNMHEPIARNAGARDEALELLAADAPLDRFEPREAMLVELARTLPRTHKLDDDLYARAVAMFGERPLVELVTLIGYYTMIAGVLGAFDITQKFG
jgi:4-carboxymuconolactone decarboxylase